MENGESIEYANSALKYGCGEPSFHSKLECLRRVTEDFHATLLPYKVWRT